jgi:bifunctional UDP-N-acetylglucosamine pyrophosphorylase / glucosamine-1-phosphate N-acetyltransferase
VTDVLRLALRSGRVQFAIDPAIVARRIHMPKVVSPLSVVILAAGQGKRMKSALPKVLQPLAGQPLLRHVVETARRLQPAAIHVVYGHGGEQVRQAFPDTDLQWALQAEQLGTGHAVMQAMPQVPDDHTVLVLYGDVPLIRADTLRDLIAQAGTNSMAVLTVALADPTGYGRIVRDARGRIQKIVEQKDATKRQLAIREGNTGVLAAQARRLRQWLGTLRADNAQREYYLTDTIAAAVKARLTVSGVVALTEAEVLGVNDKRQLAQLEAELRAQLAEDLMLAGVTLVDPLRVDVRGELTCGSDVSIDVNVVFEGRVILGDRVSIGPNCVIRDSEIGADTRVFPSCVIDSAKIGGDCNIGPFARFRPSSRLADRVHIGNFVEVKNSTMANDSKANHLAYVGDASVGARVNIGAGTIVANYDGANKHRTEIGDDAHTGSNSVLVAPIVIGAGATVGAGSTVTRQVPAGKLTVARAKQITLDGWKRPTKNK